MRYRNPQKPVPPEKLALTPHNNAILEIQARDKAEQGIDWHRGGFRRGVVKAIHERIKLDEYNQDAENEAEKATWDDVAEHVDDDLRTINRLVPDLWRIDLLSDPPCIHVVEVEDTSRLTDKKLSDYSDLDHAVEGWGFNLRIWVSNRYGMGLQEINLEKIFWEVVVPGIKKSLGSRVP